MNQVFYVEELVQRIAFNADDGSSGSVTLLALACCCRALESPVMDVLWQRQKHLHIILQSLPADCWAIANETYHLTRAPTTDEVHRFRGYAARVVELFVGGCHSTRISSQAISFLGMQSILDPLWPRLTSFRLVDGPGLGWDASYIPTFLTFLSPKIIALTLALPLLPGLLLQPVLAIASDRCRQLQELVLDNGTFNPYPTDAVEGLITACRDTLRTLEIRSPFNAEHLPGIANLPQLRSLKLGRAQIPPDLPPNIFPSLEEFVILRFDGQHQNFFNRLRTVGLKTIKIHYVDFFRVIEEPMAALSRFSASLEVLEISGVASLKFPSAVVPRPLFTNLRTLYVGCLRWENGDHHGPCTFQPTNESVVELGAVMPNITHLTLGSPTCSNLRCVTFLSLVSLSRACQDLEILMIRVDFRSMIVPSLRGSGDVDTGGTFDGTQGSACKLRRLVVGLSTLPNHPDSGWIVATGLGKIFPSLSEVVGSDQDGWGKVGRNIRMIRQVLRTVQQ